MKMSVGLNSRDLRKAAEEVSRRENSFTTKCDELVRRLANVGVSAAVETVRKRSGNLASSITTEKRGEANYVVIAQGRYVAFVEFGTGVVGEGTYPGELSDSWGYDERRTPEAHDPNDPTKWYYYDEYLGHVSSTRGQTANAFMTTADHRMRDQVLAIAKEVFKRD